MRAIAILAGRELRDSLRNRRVAGATLLMAALSLTLTLLGSAPTGSVGISMLSVTIVSLASLTVFLVPLIALLIAHDAIAGELERGTLGLLLAYPVRRIEVVVGKFVGHTLVLAVAAIVGYGAAALTLALRSDAVEAGAWGAFVLLVGSSILLGMAFVALGYLASTTVRDPRTAAAMAIGLWLFFVLVYDMAVLGALVADQGRTFTPSLVTALLFGNPADLFRLANLTADSNVSLHAGLAGMAHQVPAGTALVLAALAAWIVVPLALAALLFQRREL